MHVKQSCGSFQSFAPRVRAEFREGGYREVEHSMVL